MSVFNDTHSQSLWPFCNYFFYISFFVWGKPQPPTVFRPSRRSSNLAPERGVWWMFFRPLRWWCFLFKQQISFFNKNKMLGGLNVQKSRISKVFKNQTSICFKNYPSVSWILSLSLGESYSPRLQFLKVALIFPYYTTIWPFGINQ